MRASDASRLVLLGAIWGSSFLFIELALRDFSPLQIVAARIVIGALVVVALIYARGLRLPGGARVWLFLLVMALVSNVLPFALITWGQESISSGLASILNSTTPLFTALLAALFLPLERLTPLRALGIAIGFVGVGVIVGVDAERASLLGGLAVVVGSGSYGVGFVFARRNLAGRVAPLRLSGGQLIMGSLLSLPLATVETASNDPNFTVVGVLSVLELGALGTGVAYFIYYRLVEDVGATTASFVTYLIPIFGVTLGALFLDERLGWNALVGALLVVFGIALTERRARPATVVPPEIAAEEPR